MSPPEVVLQQVARRIVPPEKERERMLKLSERLRQDVKRILADSGFQGRVTLQGSFARDTWLSGETDLDIFARFPSSMERGEWTERVLPAIRKGLALFNVIERYAEHPFLEFHVDGTRVNVVPCYDVEKGEWKSATDRTPYHTEFMNTNLTPELRLEARLLKKFARGIGVYGAEIKVGGFSGMLIDTLALYCGSFMESIRQASSWTQGTLLEIGKPPAVLDMKKREPGVDLVVIDPVDPDRNLAAAVRPERLWSFVAAGREFLRGPEIRYFFPPQFTRKTNHQFAERIRVSGRELSAIVFKHRALVPDVLWGQLMKLEKSMVELMDREDFHIYRSTIWSDEKIESAILLEADRAVISSVKMQKGPPVSKKEDSQSFLQRHLGARDTARGPWIEGDRWMVEKKRRISTIADLVKASLREEAYGLTIPKQIGESLTRTMRVLQGRSVLSLLGRAGFDKSLWEFLEAKPSWLKQTP
ncbi:CCA-adding enzyme [archaeon 13_1_40CM_4_53_4]|nr:MAG: CCA-adding enzyme [archaeon 13_1_40CM_4_53_4]OLE59768.1 MAG: CCA-adding enzyme [Crenarchaeota archaeon 13_1_20CM_2_53_14]